MLKLQPLVCEECGREGEDVSRYDVPEWHLWKQVTVTHILCAECAQHLNEEMKNN
jgi:hypothetical protein